MDEPTYLHQRASTAITRQVWAAVTAEPSITLRALAERFGHGIATIGAALNQLRRAGYIDYDPRTSGARRIVIPFAVIRIRKG